MQGALVMQSEKGFTLIEMLIAMVVFSLIMLGALQSLVTTYRHGTLSTIRNEAVDIAEEISNTQRNVPYGNLVGTPATQTIIRQIAGGSIQFTVTQVITVEIPNVKSIRITVAWSSYGQNYTHVTTIIVGNS